jgi:hypothetical protein
MLDGRPCSLHPELSVVAACNRCGDFGCTLCLPDGRRCLRCAPSWPVEKPDLGVAFKWVFQDPDYVSKILVGAACVVFSFFLVPIFILLGYHLEVARRERQAPQQRLPEWSDWGRYAWDGLKFYFCIFLLVMAIELVFFAVVIAVIAIVALAGSAGGGAGAVIGGLIGLAAVLTLLPVSLAIAYAFPALQLEYLRTGSVGAGFHVGNIWRIVSQRPGDYFMLWVSQFVTRFLGNFVGQLLCLVGVVLTAPWVLYTEGWLLGRYWAWLDRVEGLD